MSYLYSSLIPKLVIGDEGNFTIFYNVSVSSPIRLSLVSPNTNIVHLGESNITLFPNLHSVLVSYLAENIGSAIYSMNSSRLVTQYIHFTVVHSNVLEILSTIIGWLYFIAWSISFYPQIFLNFYRRSVVGLNFDFLAYNLIGFTFYAIFNSSLFWSLDVQKVYFSQHPGGINPVKLNDVIFAFHAVLLTLITILQCFCFKRQEQKVSYTAIIIICGFFFTVIITGIVTLLGISSWLIFLYVLSYIKLLITLIKYVPQAYMNFKRKSTDGWSIGNVLLDFTGGLLSIFQMFIISYNNDDWGSIFGDPTKFGLGLFSVLFDTLFVIQHYVLYRVPGRTCAFSKTTDKEKEPLIKQEAILVN